MRVGLAASLGLCGSVVAACLGLGCAAPNLEGRFESWGCSCIGCGGYQLDVYPDGSYAGRPWLATAADPPARRADGSFDAAALHGTWSRVTPDCIRFSVPEEVARWKKEAAERCRADPSASGCQLGDICEIDPPACKPLYRERLCASGGGYVVTYPSGGEGRMKRAGAVPAPRLGRAGPE